MNRWKICSALLALAMVALFVPASNAQSIPVVAVGSSALFPSASIAFTVGDPVRGVTTPLCGARFWTGSASAVDARSALTSPAIPAEGGTLAVAWDSDTAPTIICAYLSVDSIVGQRLFFGQGSGTAGNATLSIPTAACTTAGGNKIAFVWDTATAGLPVAVWNALQGGNSTMTNCSGSTTSNPVHFNVAFTDVRPEDAQFVENNRVLANDSNTTSFYPTDDKSAMGYGPGVTSPGTPVLSSFSGASAQAVAYAFTGTDPISTVTIPKSVTFTVGAEAVIPFVNTLDTSSAGFGTLTSGGTLTSVSSHSLGFLYSGQAVLTRDLVGGTPNSLAAKVVNALQREPMSGTYTTFEFQVVRQRDSSNGLSQESGVCGPSQGTSCTGQATGANTFSQSATAFPTVTGANPLSACVGSSCGLRTRVIGTGQMVSVANTASFTSNSILGYAFWSLGSFGGKANIKYLALDGADGLFPSYSTHNGAFPGVVTTTGMAQGVNAIVAAPAAGQCAGYFNGDGTTISKFSCNAYSLPTFDGIQSGTYRAWNILRGVYYGTAAQPICFGNGNPVSGCTALNIAGFVASAQDQTSPSLPVASRIPDILPTQVCANASCSSQTSILNNFRSHYTFPSWGLGFADNGIQSGHSEIGGDVAGAVVNIQTELDAGTLFGVELFPFIQ